MFDFENIMILQGWRSITVQSAVTTKPGRLVLGTKNVGGLQAFFILFVSFISLFVHHGLLLFVCVCFVPLTLKFNSRDFWNVPGHSCLSRVVYSSKRIRNSFKCVLFTAELHYLYWTIGGAVALFKKTGVGIVCSKLMSQLFLHPSSYCHKNTSPFIFTVFLPFSLSVSLCL